jgi:hypothetical protein
MTPAPAAGVKPRRLVDVKGHPGTTPVCGHTGAGDGAPPIRSNAPPTLDEP